MMLTLPTDLWTAFEFDHPQAARNHPEPRASAECELAVEVDSKNAAACAWTLRVSLRASKVIQVRPKHPMGVGGLRRFGRKPKTCFRLSRGLHPTNGPDA